MIEARALYTQKGLLRRFERPDLAAWLDDELRARTWRDARHQGHETRGHRVDCDEHAQNATPSPNPADPTRRQGKTFFHNAPFLVPSGKFYAGRVTPVVHYTMGGVRVDNLGRVVRAGPWSVIPGAVCSWGSSAARSVQANRLGGNALTECAVFGRIVGGDVPVASSSSSVDAGGEGGADGGGAARAAKEGVTEAELSRHKSEESCWVAVCGEVCFTDFLDEHPAGAEAITKYGGTDGTKGIFDSVHSRDMLGRLDALRPLVR